MARTRALISLLVLACLGALLASPARADHGRPILDETLAAYLGAAATHWGGQAPSCETDSGPPIQVHAVMFDDPDPTVAARAEQPGCRIWLDRDHWPQRPSEQGCVAILHEWGHLLGQGHSRDRRGLMWPWPQTGPRGCAAFGSAPRDSARAAMKARRAIAACGRAGGPRPRCAGRRWMSISAN